MKRKLTPSNMRTARALTARSLKEISKLSDVDASILADFERGLQPSLGERTEAVEFALEKAGAFFEPDGSVSMGGPAAPPPALTSGNPHRWITAQDLVTWGATRDGQAFLSELVGRLILATVGPAARMRFPAGDSVQFSGWDGVCTTYVGAGPVPSGVSVWEFTVQRNDLRGKASRDIDKRSTGPTDVKRAETIFFFLTLQRFPDKDAWAQEYRDKGIWKDILAIDGDELVHWIDLCPGVSEWLAQRIGKRPGGLRTIAKVFDEWSLATAPPLSADLLAADRDEEATAVLRWLKGPPAIFAVQAESTEEALAFPFAAIGTLPFLHRIYWESRMVVCTNDDAARGLLGLSAKLIVVMADSDPGLAAALVKAGHNVYLTSQANVTNGTRLPRPWRFTIQKALEAMGLEYRQAQTMARDCGRSLTVLRRLMFVAGSRPPTWADAPVSRSLLAAMLAGRWDSGYPVDKAILERLAGRNYAELEAELAPLAVAINGPVRKSGTVWKLTSLRDAWFLIAGHLTGSIVDTLFAVFEEAMSENDPGYDVGPEDKWKIDFEPPKRASEGLRHGLTDAITALAVFPSRAANVHDAAFRSERAIAKLLKDADERRWWSLSDDFRRLAEASPRAFMDALEKALEGEPPPIDALFRIDEGFIHPDEYLTDLLWALEILAWSSEYLDRVSFLLCRLVEKDTAERRGNKPDSTLRRIYLPWLPQTFASAAQRLDVIDAMVEFHPRPAWGLLLALAPDNFSSSTPSVIPAWRDFSAGAAPIVVTRAELFDGYREIGRRLVAAAGSDAGRWAVLLNDWQSFDAEWRTDAAVALGRAIAGFNAGERRGMWERLRQVIGRHEQFPQADWTLKGEALEPLKTLFRQLEPDDPIERNSWMFGGPTFDYRGDRPWHEMQEQAERERKVAAQEIVAASSVDAVVEMARSVRLPRLLGEAITLSSVSDAQKDALLERTLTEDAPALVDFGYGLMLPLRVARGERWLADRMAEGVAKGERVEALVRMALALPPNASHWATMTGAGPELEDAYWRRIDDHQIPETADPKFVVGKLLAIDRGQTALTWVGVHRAMAVPADLVTAILRHPSTLSGSDRVVGGTTMWQHYAVEAFKRLDADPTASANDIAGLEWAYYRLLEHSERPPHRLNRAIADDPKFFVYLMSKFYFPEGADRPSVSDDDGKVAKQAYHVLSNWDVLPGNDGREIDAAALKAWVDEVRKLAKEARLSEAVEHRIGSIFAKAERRAGSPWPPMAIRDVIEKSRNAVLEASFVTALRNARGVTVRRPNDGGDQERDLAEMYRADAKASGARQPRMRALLNRIAEIYEHDAGGEDRSAEQRDWT